ncbi:hypothetical protein ZOSMA_18G00890 [Zostera marina]|uniref:UV radiation resistance-associated gene protein n=1 Tax=Zostera marina TaxID=29655 RepID=A0A0K9PPI6_ZOSMR|nr:hypothetical protein ZOSMA_18G00890 [Zostera marina]
MNSDITSDRVSSSAEFIEMEDRPATSGLPGKLTPDEEEKSREQEEMEGKEIVVIGYDRPKVIQWDDLQQELGRLLSLSAEIKRVKEMKEDLSRRIESVIEAEKGSLLQQNELEKSRKRMDAKRQVMGDLLFRSKRATEDARIKREELCYEIRWLLVASKTLSVARQQLQEEKKLVAGEKGHGRHKNLHSMLRSRQRHMVTQVSMIYPVWSSTSQAAHENPNRCPNDTKSGNHSRISSTNVPESTHISLSILGVQPVIPQLKRMSFFGDKKEAQKSATALGYVAHVVLRIATYLGVPLRYSIFLGGSRSYIHDFTPSVDLTPSDLTSNLMTGAVSQPAKFPLFLEAQDTTKAAYAIFLLNKDLEQILNYIGGQSLGPGPKHILVNLKRLISMIQSPAFANE